MKATDFIRRHYSLFGIRGVWLATQALLQRRFKEVVVAVPVINNLVHIRLRSSDLSVFSQVLITAGYDCDFARPPRTIVDAGAHIGLCSVFFANRYRDAKIVAIEPEKSNYALLEKNTASYPNVIPVQGVLWKNSDEVSILDPGFGTWGFQTTDAATPGVAARGQKKSRGMSVDTLMKEYDIDYIDLLKVDIEGSEKEVFENAQE